MARMLVPYDFVTSPAERALERFLGWVSPYGMVCEDWEPASDVAETDKAFLITMELPGIDMKKMDITFNDGYLNVKGEKVKESAEGECCHFSERFSGSFMRSFRINGNVDRDKIEATYKDGILKLVVPKSEEIVPKRIEVH